MAVFRAPLLSAPGFSEVRTGPLLPAEGRGVAVEEAALSVDTIGQE